ncbi:MAG TPA: imidazole glycerol phosphate synthase subunit HisH [Rhodospirillaceae bacterium]|nr:imidazole glycerol phosphate synthase subunit HisH [Rhodospirillaceae bacterium]|tara:strand:+ start:33954 stop:34571 length:618 start_codon:yes stop_codon:yes gene_type:complete
MIGIVDYGLGNLTSVAGAVAKSGFEPVVTSDGARLEAADKLILPGVGAFPDGMANLAERGLIDILDDLVIKRRKPILGICLGFQLLGLSSAEFGDTAGLGWIDAPVTRLQPEDQSLRVPHVGWNDLSQTAPDCVLLDGIDDGALFYFVHSYRMETPPDGSQVGTCDYGGAFTAAVQKGNVFGTQFHPEKSQQAGLTLLQNYLEKA